MRKTNLLKVITFLLMSIMLSLFSTNVLAANETDYGDLTPQVNNNAATNNANTNTNRTNNANTNNASRNNTNNTNRSNYNNTSLPKTGIEDSIPVALLLVVFGISAVYAYKKIKDYRNIAIFGIDSREDTYSKGNRSDCIIIASINNQTKEVKLVSVYRDTYVNIEGHGLDKITHAYSYGEAPLAIKTLNENLDLNIKEFVAVNFDAVQEIIDDIGGISMQITKEEVEHIPGITKAGTYNLTGEQALAYARIRYATGGDYKRTERMRDVLTAVVEKVKTLDVSGLNKLVDTVLPRLYTNISANDIFSLFPSVAEFKITQSIGWPYETRGKTIDRWYGIPVTLESNVTKLHQEIFEESDYTPSDRVKEISNNIVEKTGYDK